MGCEIGNLNGTTFVACSRGRRKVPNCRWCKKPSVALCDKKIKVGDVGHTRTCDAPVCEDHRNPVGPNVDVCPDHSEIPS